MMKKTVMLASCAAVAGHAILSVPVSRLGLDRLGTQSTKYRHDASGTAGEYPLDPAGMMETCGTDDTGPAAVVKTYNVGDMISFSWLMTLAHPGTPENVRLAIKYSPTDTFAANVLFADMSADISGSTTPGNGGTITKTATAKLTKPCESCVLQWSWDSKADGGGYIDCADIKILAEGEAIPGPKAGNPKCIAFCSQISTTCAATLEQYPVSYSKIDGAAESAECVEACNAQPRTVLDGAFFGDTFECREYHLSVATTSSEMATAHCAHAGKDGGGVCVEKTPCEVFCKTYADVTCTNDVANVPDYSTEAKCLATCAKYKQTSLHGAVSGDTFQCREYHLGVAHQVRNTPVSGPTLLELHCGHVTKTPSRWCVPTVTQCQAYCATLASTCGNVTGADTATPEECETNCKTMVVGKDGATEGDTLACREYHLGVTNLARDEVGALALHCPHASANGGGVCTTPPPTQADTANTAVSLRLPSASLLAGVVVACFAL